LAVKRRSRPRAVVTDVSDFVDHHHLMVLVNGVVTVNRVAALHVTEPDQQLDLVVGPQLMSGSMIGANTASPAVAGMPGADSGS
jgi:hypothetical protein